MYKDVISIVGLGSVSAIGAGFESIRSTYRDNKHYIGRKSIGAYSDWVGAASTSVKQELSTVKSEYSDYENLDDSVLFAIIAARYALANAQWERGAKIGINLGSSRGATELMEQYHRQFLETGKTSALSSPFTTLGNVAFWVGQDLQLTGPEFSHSITCSTALHALLNGVAWLKSGLSDKFMVGGSEAPLTPFTLAQMKALRIYSKEEGPYPCRAMDFGKSSNTMVLGEGAAVACLEQGKSEKTLAYVKGWGYASEVWKHPAALSANGECLQKSMKMALGHLSPSEIDVIVMHAPGTIKGDEAELNAIKSVFGSHLPALTGNKWKIGHTLGASGMFSLELGITMLVEQKFIPMPFHQVAPPDRLKYILINAVGFGANAVSILLESP